ncbi:protein kinase [Cocleimonas sp. KMM 6892]|uniref:serine/threonine-protein kinase n=1 Tax=unclassified Cocleimonas TaxID=2639732 RepID=UPI002DBC65CB|nr:MULTISPECIES: protein kinase [unclassified Cocleimonas]MEB8434449.1 protein kinase [Cocleimonas sp. KMM 6892]MEC4717342.1 protein kinase [Cocleimonas sp. KMM 6895]MEC4746721.1 protein kinase [Cocleimonas sp. KMM 6896]
MIEIPNYTVDSELGRGGMATVYLAVQDMLSRNVALKVMLPDMARDENFRKSFLSEGKIIASLEHRNIVRIYDVGVIDDSILYMAMEHLANGTLKTKLEKGKLSYAESLRILEQTSSGLDYAHVKGYIHRDIKPGNILFREDDTAVITDFGIAKLQDTSGELTRMGYTMGTVQYMSPEQAVTTDLDSRSDIYSLGLVFYEMLTGKKAFKAESTIQAIHQHTTVAPPELPAEYSFLQPTIDKVLAKEPNDRYQTVGEFVEAVKNAVNVDQTVIHKIPPQIDDDRTQILQTGHYPVSAKEPKSKKGLYGGITGALVLVAGLAFGFTNYEKVSSWMGVEETDKKQVNQLEVDPQLEANRLAAIDKKAQEDSSVADEASKQEKAKEEKAQLEQAKLEQERLELEEKEKLKQERLAKLQQLQEKDRAAEIERQIEEDRIAAEAKKAEEARIAAENKKAEEARIAAETKKAEEARIAAETKKAEEARIAAETKKAEEARIAAENKKAEDERIAAENKKAEEKRIAAENKKAEEERIAAENKKAEEERIAAENKRAEEERIAAENKRAEDARIAAEKKRQEEIRKEKRKAEQNKTRRVRLIATLNKRPLKTSFIIKQNGKEVRRVNGKSTANVNLKPGRYQIATSYAGKWKSSNINISNKNITRTFEFFKKAAPAKTVNGQIRAYATLNGRPLNTSFVVTKNGKRVKAVSGRSSANFVLPPGNYVITTQFGGRVSRANVNLAAYDIAEQRFAFRGSAPRPVQQKAPQAQKDWTHTHNAPQRQAPVKQAPQPKKRSWLDEDPNADSSETGS